MSRQREADRQLVETIKAELAVSAARFLESTATAMRELGRENLELADFWQHGADAMDSVNSEDWG